MNILDYIFPRGCSGCGENLPPSQKGALCQSCLAKFETECRALCPICRRQHGDCRCQFDADMLGLPPEPSIGSAGTVTVTIRPNLAGARIAFHLAEYTSKKCAVTDRLILAAKNGHSRQRARFLAERLVNTLKNNNATPSDHSKMIITNIPRRRAAITDHGCDQAADLAREIAGIIGAPYRYSFMHVGRAEQKELSREARLRNARASYKLRHNEREKVNGKVVVLVDDIVTTGASMSVCADLLTEAGAERVICLSVGRRYKKHSNN